MNGRRWGVAVVVEGLVALLLLAIAATAEERRKRHLSVGFAIGFLYRHTRTGLNCDRARDRPLRAASLTVAWAALCVAFDRSLGTSAARCAMGAGIAFGSAGYRFAQSSD